MKLKKNKSFGLNCLFLMIGVFFFGCSSLQYEQSPYLITEQYVSFENENGFFNYAGAFFSIYNRSGKDFSKLTLCFSLFDEEGNVVGLGNGQFRTNYVGEIRAGENKDIVINLDDVIGNCNETLYRIDFVYVSSITYTDGTVWQDLLGLYSL